jgi:hypothetical protein
MVGLNGFSADDRALFDQWIMDNFDNGAVARHDHRMVLKPAPTTAMLLRLAEYMCAENVEAYQMGWNDGFDEARG